MSATDTTDRTVDNVLISSSSLQARPIERQSKSSSIQFAPDPTPPAQARASRRTVSFSDETTPIKRSDAHLDRQYHTSDTSRPLPSPQPVAKINSTSQPTELPQPPSWYKRIAEKYGSIQLENKASVARDHLALERTFLAWLRTSLSFASIGIAVTQLFRLNATVQGGRSKRSYDVADRDWSSTANLPFSPFIGHAIPAEIVPYLQHTSSAVDNGANEYLLGPTLLDQMLQLTAGGSSINPHQYYSSQTDMEATNKLRHVGKPLGATFIGISVVVLLVGFQRYFEAQHWIIHGKFPASRGSITLVAFIAFALVIASLVIVVVISPSSYET